MGSSHLLRRLQNMNMLTHFRPMSPFCSSWKHQKTRSFFKGSKIETLAGNGLKLIWHVFAWNFIYLRWFIYYLRKIFQKSNISCPLTDIRTCTHQGVRNLIFSENFANALNESSLSGWLILTLLPVSKCLPLILIDLVGRSKIIS